MSKKKEVIIKLDSSVKAEVLGKKLQVTGPKGSLSIEFPAGVEINLSGESLKVSILNQDRSTLGLYGALAANLVAGVSRGFSKKLEMIGVGFKAKKDGRDLILTIGFSHPVKYSPPQGCEIQVSEDTKIEVVGINRQLVGQVAAEIRKLKRPEPYKGKGIKYSGEVVRRKAGKAGKVGAAK